MTTLLANPNQPCHEVIPVTPAHPQPRHQPPTPCQTAIPARASKTRHLARRTRRVPTQPRSGMTRNGQAYALPTPGRRTGATGSSSSATSQRPGPGLRLLPTPVAGVFNDGESVTSWLARRDRQKILGRNGNGIGTPLSVAIALLPAPLAHDGAAERARQLGGQRPSGAKRQVGLPEVIAHHLTGPAMPAAARERLLPTPDTGTSPRGHGRRGGRPGNGHQSGKDLDAAARTLTPGPAPGTSTTPVAWREYEPAIRRWEQILGQSAPPPAEPGPAGRARLSAAFAEWMMGIPGLVTGVPGLPRTAALRIIGNASSRTRPPPRSGC
jgi:DNA (cytosine-5)-methyltransferase 1